MHNANAEKYTQLLRDKAHELGFSFCGIAQAAFLEEEAPRLESWLRRGLQGQMSYLENHFDKRLDPTLLVPGATSVVSLILNYYPETDLGHSDTYKIAKYAYGEDYHFFVKRKLKDLLYFLREEIGEIEGRVFVDSAPVMERAWAQRSGLGWIGKNSLLLNKQQGSFFFLAEMILDLPLVPDAPTADYCGTCTRCIDACPTEAITPYEVDGSRCISYFTIELKEHIPSEFAGQYANWIFGCDICQDVCPWNRFSKPHTFQELKPSEDMRSLKKRDWEEMTEEVFQKVFKKSALKRTKFNGLMRNISFLQQKTSK